MDASLCITQTSFGTSVGQGTTRTTATQVKSGCATITACGARDSATTSTVKSCQFIAPTAVAEVQSKLPERGTESEGTRKRAPAPPNWTCDSQNVDVFILMRDPYDNDAANTVRNYLKDRDSALGQTNGFYESRAEDMGFTALFHVPKLGHTAKNWFNSNLRNEVRPMFSLLLVVTCRAY